MISTYRIFFVVFISIIFSSCHEKEYDILQEAKNLIINKSINKDTSENKNNDLDRENNIQLEKEKININDKIGKNNEDKVKNKENLKKSNTKDNAKVKLSSDNEKISRVLDSIKEKKKNSESFTEEKKEYKPEEKKFNQKSKIKVGVMLPLSGKHGEIGNLILNAMEMAIFQTEENKLQLIIKDTEGKPERAKEVFKDLIDQNINIFIGPLFSKTLASIQSFSNNSNLNVFALTNNTNLGKEGIWIFGVDPQAQTRKALDVALNKNSKKIAALLPKNAYGLLLFDTISDFCKQNSIQIESVEFFESSIESQRKAAQNVSNGFTEYQEYLNKIKKRENNEINIKDNLFLEKPFDSVFIAASGQNLTVLSSQLQYNNVDPNLVQYLGISSWDDKSILNEPALEGGIFATTSQLYQKKIKQIYKNSFNKEMPKIAMIAYDIVALLGSVNYLENFIERKDIINQEGYLGLRGLFRLKDNGIVERTFELK